MKSVFIDSSVLFSACRSKIGTPALLIAYCRKGKIVGYISPGVIVEVKRNISTEDSNVKQRFNAFLLQSNLEIVKPVEAEIINCAQVIHTKDAHVLAAAKKSNADYLVTLDKKDFMQQKVAEFMKPSQISTPKKFLKQEKLI